MLLGTGAALMAAPIASSTAGIYDWRSIAPTDAGFAPDMEARLDKVIADKRAWKLHGVVVVRNGRLVLERYFEDEDNARGRPLGKAAYAADVLHDMRSVSKGVVGLLYGIALEQGKVPLVVRAIVAGSDGDNERAARGGSGEPRAALSFNHPSGKS
jgi:CubicO group peptidase (beta-lactamase class C family)